MKLNFQVLRIPFEKSVMVWVYSTFGNGVIFGGYYEIFVCLGGIIISISYLEIVISFGLSGVSGFILSLTCDEPHDYEPAFDWTGLPLD